jgi:ABC-type microcin C transport system duplicated ATPase subunit YejF
MIFQDPYASLNPRWRVAAIVAEPMLALDPAMPRTTLARRVAEQLEQVGWPRRMAGNIRTSFRVDSGNAFRSRGRCPRIRRS